MSGLTSASSFGSIWSRRAQQRATFAFVREHGVAHIVVDGPQASGTACRPLWEVTHPTLALVRLHGRNHDTWNVKG